MPTIKKPFAAAIAGALFGLAVASPAHAGLITSTAGVAFNYSTSTSDSEGGGATTLSNVPLGSTSLTKFDPSLGVLTGTTLTLSSTRTQTTSVTSTNGPDTGTNQIRTTTGTGSSSAGLAAGGLTASLGTVSQTDNCTAGRLGACNDGASSSATTTNGSFGIAASNGYVGAGTVSVQASVPTLTANQSGAQFTGTESTAYQLDWAGSLALSYDYLLHAIASFSAGGAQGVLNLDFGDVALGSAASLGFGLFNLFDADRVGLDLDSITGGGDTDRLTTDLVQFNGLYAGNHEGFEAGLDTHTTGLFEASYRLDLSDADIGADASRHAYVLTLNLRGNVIQPRELLQPQNDVPEPSSVGLLAVGLAGLGGATIRRRKAPAA